MDQINNERRSRQALAKQAREEAISTPRGVENKPTPVKVIGKRPPVSSVAPTTTETVIEETLEQKPATEVTKVEKEEVVKEPEKPVTENKTKVKKEKTGGKVKMTTAKKQVLDKVLHDINEETKLKDVMSNGELDIKSVNKKHKVKILQAIFEEENLQASDTKLGEVISKYENALCFLAKNGAKFKFGNAKQTEIKGYNILGATAVNVRQATNPRNSKEPLPENETHFIWQRQNGFKLTFGFGEELENIKGRLADNGNTFIDTTGKSYVVNHNGRNKE